MRRKSLNWITREVSVAVSHPARALFRAEIIKQPTIAPLNEILADAVPSITRRLRTAETLSLDDTPVIDGNIIRYRPALMHPVLNRPVAFLQGFEVGPLFSTLKEGLTSTEVAKRWSQRMTSTQCFEILQWIWNRSLISAQDG